MKRVHTYGAIFILMLLAVVVFIPAIGTTSEAAIDVDEIDLSAVESAQAHAEQALEGIDPFELERLEKNVQVPPRPKARQRPPPIGLFRFLVFSDKA